MPQPSRSERRYTPNMFLRLPENIRRIVYEQIVGRPQDVHVRIKQIGIRIRIWGYPPEPVFRGKAFYQYDPEWVMIRNKRASELSFLLSFLRTCRAVRDEALDLLFSTPVFVFDLAEDAREFSNHLRNYNRNYIRFIQFTLTWTFQVTDGCNFTPVVASHWTMDKDPEFLSNTLIKFGGLELCDFVHFTSLEDNTSLAFVGMVIGEEQVKVEIMEKAVRRAQRREPVLRYIIPIELENKLLDYQGRVLEESLVTDLANFLI